LDLAQESMKLMQSAVIVLSSSNYVDVAVALETVSKAAYGLARR
jgi:hypothetical protein